MKTTPIMVRDFMSSDVTEMSFIPLRSLHQAQQPPAIRFRIVSGGCGGICHQALGSSALHSAQ